MGAFGVREPVRPREASKEEFAGFYGREFPRLVALLHALHGGRLPAQRVAERAFTRAWMHWSKVRTMSDPAAWTRAVARKTRAPHTTDPNWHDDALESEWVAPRILPVFEALSRVSAKHRTVLALRYVGGLTVEQIAQEESRAPEAITVDLAAARAALADKLGGPPRGRGYVEAQEALTSDAMTSLARELYYAHAGRVPDTVFQSAHRRAWIAGIAAGVGLVGLAGTTAVLGTQHAELGTGRPAVVAPLPDSSPGPVTGSYPPAAATPHRWGGPSRVQPVPADRPGVVDPPSDRSGVEPVTDDPGPTDEGRVEQRPRDRTSARQPDRQPPEAAMPLAERDRDRKDGPSAKRGGSATPGWTVPIVGDPRPAEEEPTSGAAGSGTGFPNVGVAPDGSPYAGVAGAPDVGYSGEGTPGARVSGGSGGGERRSSGSDEDR
jgi:RNA polymerase sigma-70 factor (ECF subfamily)